MQWNMRCQTGGRSILEGQRLSGLQPQVVSLHVSSLIHGFDDIPGAVGVDALLKLMLNPLSVLDVGLLSDCLSLQLALGVPGLVRVGVVGLVVVVDLRILGQVISVGGSDLEKRPEELRIVLGGEGVSAEEVQEVVVGGDRLDLAEGVVVVGASPEVVVKVVVGLTDFNELPLALLVVEVVLWMVPKTQLSEGSLDLQRTGIPGNTQNLVVALLPFGIQPGELVPLLLILETVRVEELREEVECGVDVELGLELVVARPGARVGEDVVGLGDVVELPLRIDSVVWVFVRVIEVGESVVGVVDVLLRGPVLQSQDLVVISFGSHLYQSI